MPRRRAFALVEGIAPGCPSARSGCRCRGPAPQVHSFGAAGFDGDPLPVSHQSSRAAGRASRMTANHSNTDSPGRPPVRCAMQMKNTHGAICHHMAQSAITKARTSHGCRRKAPGRGSSAPSSPGLVGPCCSRESASVLIHDQPERLQLAWACASPGPGYWPPP